jgi:glycosyltransferase involved in cell wall biosynthesis
MKKSPYISVIIPAYNEENYISRCLDSLLAQKNCSNFEVIVADNNSTDNTAQIVKAYRRVILVNASNRGVAFARQAALEKAAGEIIVSTDADCTFSSLWLSKIEAQFRNNNISGLAGNYHFINAPLWARVFPYLGAVLVWMIYLITGKTIYASAANLSFRRKYVTGYSTLETQGSDERGIILQLRKRGKIKVILNNPVFTSARRVRKGFFHGVFVTIGYYYSYNVWQTRKKGYSAIGHQPVVRSEESDSLLESLERYFIIFILILILVLVFK